MTADTSEELPVDDLMHRLRITRATMPFDSPQDRACRDGIVVLEQLRSELNAAYSRINELTGLLRSLLVDCDNWGTAPDDRYREALS